MGTRRRTNRRKGGPSGRIEEKVIFTAKTWASDPSLSVGVPIWASAAKKAQPGKVKSDLSWHFYVNAEGHIWAYPDKTDSQYT